MADMTSRENALSLTSRVDLERFELPALLVISSIRLPSVPNYSKIAQIPYELYFKVFQYSFSGPYLSFLNDCLVDFPSNRRKLFATCQV